MTGVCSEAGAILEVPQFDQGVFTRCRKSRLVRAQRNVSNVAVMRLNGVQGFAAFKFPEADRAIEDFLKQSP